MNKITGRELDPNQFPAWAEFTPSGESLTKVSARDGFQIDLGNPLTLEDLSLTSLRVSGLSTLHDIDIKDSSETVILQRNGSTLETLIDQGGTPTMARIGAGIIESGGEGCLFGNGLRHFLGRWSFVAYFTPGVWHDVCLIYGMATIMAISSENAYMQPWLINCGWHFSYGQIISATMNPDMGHSHSRDFQWRVVDAGGSRGKLQTAAISYSTTRRITFNVALLSRESSIEWLIGAV